MSSDGIQPPENGCASSEDLRARRSLKSSVIPDNDPLKIKLKISKRDLGDIGKPKKEEKTVKDPTWKSDFKNGEDKAREEYEIRATEEKPPRGGYPDEPKMKLRPKKDVDADSEEAEVPEERRRKKEPSNEKETERSFRKRMKARDETGEEGVRRRSRRNEGETVPVIKAAEIIEEPGEVNKESFCWTCHRDGSVVKCDTCPRVFHLKCVSLTKDPSKDWICPECSLVLHAEKMSTRSEAMKSLSLDQLCTLLSFAIDRMKNVPESQVFWKPVDPKEVPFYDKYITNPMDLNQLERNMKAKMYGSPQAFLADAKWLLHNSIIFNSTQSPLTSTARFLVKICRQEMAEIENCPDCYLNAHTKEDWFIEVCRKPHILIWARLKGFPFWPAKAMSTNLKTQQVDARFFGAHDKAWVPVKECYLYSKNSPQLLSKRRTDLDEAFLEVEGYIRKIRQKYGSFCYAPDKTHFMPEMYDKQLQSLIPNYREEKPLKKKRKSSQVVEENGVAGEKPVQNGKRAGGEQGAPHRFKLKRPILDDSSKVVGDVCPVNDYVSEEKVANEDQVCPEDEIARSLEMYDTHKKVEGDATEENSTDMDEDESVPIPEHGYSRTAECGRSAGSASSAGSLGEEGSSGGVGEVGREAGAKECVGERSECPKGREEGGGQESVLSSEQCEVSSTSGDLKGAGPEVGEGEREREGERDGDGEGVGVGVGVGTEGEGEAEAEAEAQVQEEKGVIGEEGVERSSGGEGEGEKGVEGRGEATSSGPGEEPGKKEEEKSVKSFGNLSCDQQQKILTEAKLLANIDEMTASGKQKVLNDLGLDASQVDIGQLARENRQILETLNKKCHGERKSFEDVPIKNEDFEQYLMEENSEVIDDADTATPAAVAPPTSPKLGSIKVRDFHTLSKSKTTLSPPRKPGTEPMLKIMDVQSLRELKLPGKEPKPKLKRKRSAETSQHSKKLKLEPVIELIKLDNYDESVEKLNRKLRLSDEVSLLMVDGERKLDLDPTPPDRKKTKPPKHPRARKSIPNRSNTSPDQPSPNINVISVDTENTAAQKNLLKSLCLEEKKPDDGAAAAAAAASARKTVLITTNDKGIKNVDVKSAAEPTAKKSKEVTIEALKDSAKVADATPKDNAPAHKNVALMTNSHLIVTNNGPAIVTNQTAQPNLALTQNNLGQLSLVHLSNLSSGIQTNFINLTNETIGFNSGIGTLYASPGFGAEFPASSGAGSVILTPSLTTSGVGGGGVGGGGGGGGVGVGVGGGGGGVGGGLKGSKGGSEGVGGSRLGGGRVGSGKGGAGISVKSPASLGLVASQGSKLPPLIAIPGDGVPLGGEVGPVTAELNKHSMKMAEYMRATIEDILRELSSQGSLEAKYKLLSIEMEKLQWRHQQEMMELKHHSERSLMELRNSLESEKQKCLGELKAQLESQHQKVISETKRKQWCANCGKEALFYCCWNTSYCDYPCQQQHWPGHMSTCAQLGNNVTVGSSPSSQLQSKTPGMKYQNSSYVPVMSRGSGNGGGTHTGGVFAASRAVSNVQAGAAQARRSSDPSAPQIPVNITIRPQHYFM